MLQFITTFLVTDRAGEGEYSKVYVAVKVLH